jgi:glutaminyl-tRNA synthetase
MKWGD